jgi:Methyltransferase domain
MGSTLIFPCTVPASASYADAAKQRGEHVVAASSSFYDETATNFDTWFYLPNVHDKTFLPQLKDALARHDVDRIYCPVLIAYNVLSRFVAEGHLNTSIVGEMPITRHLREHQKLLDLAAVYHALIESIAEQRSNLTLLEVASVLRQTLGIYGESYEAKIAAVMAIFADAPSGDVVEIGTLAGRSACALLLMARRYEIGAVLAVDAWSAAESRQCDSPKDVQTAGDAWDMGALFESFVISLLPLAGKNDFNYLAMPSRQAYAVWSRYRHVTEPLFGEVRYCGAISVLHIDGNHDYDRVKQDCELWLPHLVSGGWLILDDYVWLHGDGPRRVGDALLESRAGNVQHAFVCGKALFIKLVADAP